MPKSTWTQRKGEEKLTLFFTLGHSALFEFWPFWTANRSCNGPPEILTHLKPQQLDHMTSVISKHLSDQKWEKIMYNLEFAHHLGCQRYILNFFFFFWWGLRLSFRFLENHLNFNNGRLMRYFWAKWFHHILMKGLFIQETYSTFILSD